MITKANAKSLISWALAAGLGSACLVTPALAEEAAKTNPLVSVGNSLIESGVFVRADYTGEWAANPYGGIKQGELYAGQLNLGADFDMDKIAGIKGGAMHVTFTDRHGRDLASTKIGNSISVQEVFGGGQTYRLTEFTWDQALFDDKVEVLVGRTAAPSDFAASPFYCFFQNNATCGNPGLLGKDNFLDYYPVGVWGGRVRVKPTEAIYAQVGAYEEDAWQGDKRRHGFDWNTAHATGVVLPFEVGYRTTPDKAALPTGARVGFFYESGDYADPYHDVNNQSAALTGGDFKIHHGRTTIYAGIDQQVWRPDPKTERGLYIFGDVAAATQRDQISDYFVQLGVVDKGPFASRPDDHVGFVVSDTHFSSATQKFLRDSRIAAGGSGKTDPNEFILEANYGAQLMPWLKVTPNLQYIINPDQTNEPQRLKDIPNAFVVGIKFNIGLAELVGMPTKTFSR